MICLGFLLTSFLVMTFLVLMFGSQTWSQWPSQLPFLLSLYLFSVTFLESIFPKVYGGSKRNSMDILLVYSKHANWFHGGSSPGNLFYCFIGCLIRHISRGSSRDWAIGDPINTSSLHFRNSADSSIIMLTGIIYGAMYGGSTTSILMNIPGESASVVYPVWMVIKWPSKEEQDRLWV